MKSNIGPRKTITSNKSAIKVRLLHILRNDRMMYLQKLFPFVFYLELRFYLALSLSESYKERNQGIVVKVRNHCLRMTLYFENIMQLATYAVRAHAHVA